MINRVETIVVKGIIMANLSKISNLVLFTWDHSFTLLDLLNSSIEWNYQVSFGIVILYL